MRPRSTQGDHAKAEVEELQAEDLGEEIDRLQERRRELRAEIDQVESELDAAEGALIDGTGDLEDAEALRTRRETLQSAVGRPPRM